MASSACANMLVPFYSFYNVCTDEKITGGRKLGRILSGLAGMALGCYLSVLVGKAIYPGIAKAEGKSVEATTPNGTPGKDLSVSTSAKAGGGILSAMVADPVFCTTAWVVTEIGGVLTDVVVGSSEVCWEATTNCAKRCFNAFNCCTRPAKPAHPVVLSDRGRDDVKV